MERAKIKCKTHLESVSFTTFCLEMAALTGQYAGYAAIGILEEPGYNKSSKMEKCKHGDSRCAADG